MSTTSLEQFHDVRTVAQRLSISTRQLYRLIASGELSPPVKIGRASRLPESEIVAFAERLKLNRGKPVTEAP